MQKPAGTLQRTQQASAYLPFWQYHPADQSNAFSVKAIVGDTLSDALHEMVAEDKIPGDLATKVMAEFDEAMNKALEKEVTTKTTFKGHLDSYRFCDQVWTWVASDVVFRNDTASLLDTSVKEVRADKVKIVCVDARVAQS